MGGKIAFDVSTNDVLCVLCVVLNVIKRMALIREEAKRRGEDVPEWDMNGNIINMVSKGLKELGSKRGGRGSCFMALTNPCAVLVSALHLHSGVIEELP